jgi:hypothetical protein
LRLLRPSSDLADRTNTFLVRFRIYSTSPWSLPFS